MALKTILADRMVCFGKNETLFLNFEECVWSPEPFLQKPWKMDENLQIAL